MKVDFYVVDECGPLPFSLVYPCHITLYRAVFLISPAYGDTCLPFWLVVYILVPNYSGSNPSIWNKQFPREWSVK